MEPRATRGETTAAIAVVLVLFAVRYHAFLAGGVLYFRDAGFFFVPWRSLCTRLAADGFPFWNDWISSGRAFAADPNAAVFWPLAPLLLVLSPTGLALANALLVLLLFFVALRILGLRVWPSAAGCVILLFAGVFQGLTVYLGLAAVATLPVAVVAFARLGSGTGAAGPNIALAASALGVSFFGGEPAATAIGGVACGIAFAGSLLKSPRAGGRVEALPRSGAAALAFLLAGGVAAVQLLPAAGELMRSARGQELRAEHGSLFWSVRPARVLTLLEPGLTGDPLAEDPADYWGAGSFDAGNPYFHALALGLVPLALAAVSGADPRGRGALGLGLFGALLSLGRFFAPSAFVAKGLTVFRYPEKWWLLATFALAAAAAVGVERLTGTDDRQRDAAWNTLKKAALLTSVPLVVAGVLAAAGPELLRKGIWGLGLGAGESPAARVAGALVLPFSAGFLSLVVLSLLAFLVVRRRVSPAVAIAVVFLVFLADGARRVAGSCPAGPPDLYRRETPAVALVRGEMGRGRFYDDAADVPAAAARRTREAGGLDPLRPVTGVLFGIRYAGENDIDRMTPAASSRWVADTARLPWGEEKAARLRTAGVSVVRTPAPPPDPRGVVEIGRSGGDRILRIGETRSTFDFLPEAQREAGAVRVGIDRPNETRLSVDVPPGGAVLAVARTFDPNWRVVLDETAPIPVRPAEGFLSAIALPAGRHDVSMRYRNPLFTLGGILTGLSIACAVALRIPRRTV